MSSKKKTAQDKRAALPRNPDYTKPFQQDWGRLSASGRYNMNALKAAMLLLIAANGPLPPEYKDHPLKGSFAGYRECHIGGDFLLMYEVVESTNLIKFLRAGTHAELGL